jgi:predicted glycosyltransferase
MKILFYLGHPAHYHLFKIAIILLGEKGHQVTILLKTKDVLQRLLEDEHVPFVNINAGGRGDSKIQIALGLLKRDVQMTWQCFKNRPDVMVGTSVEISHVGMLLHIPSIVVNEDDFDAVPLFSKLGYPLASIILAPQSCPTGPWEYKTFHYPGYHELAYLSPAHFKPVKDLLRPYFNPDQPYMILRFAKLTAHHDQGKTGLTTGLARKIIDLVSSRFQVWITSEKELDNEFQAHRLPLPPSLIHHALYFAHFYVGDSQTMAAEAAVLGTPSVRFNDFVGKLGYLEELESKYGLTTGIKTSEPEKLIDTVNYLISSSDTKLQWKNRRDYLLDQTVDLSKLMVWLIENQEIVLSMPDLEKSELFNRFKN